MHLGSFRIDATGRQCGSYHDLTVDRQENVNVIYHVNQHPGDIHVRRIHHVHR